MVLEKVPECRYRCRPLWVGIMLLMGLVVGLGIQGLGDETTLSTSSGHWNVPWLCLTFYTVGVVFLSYYLGGIFNSHAISEEEYSRNTVLRIKSQMTFLPISEFIRRQAKAQQLRVKGCRKRTSSGKDTKDPVAVQRDLLIEAILEEYVVPWYQQISDERTLLSHTQCILQDAFNKLRTKLGTLDRTQLTVDVIELLHAHWNEYCSAITKIKSPNELFIHKFKATHSYIENREEVRQQYETLLSLFLPELLPGELNSPLFSKFLSGILVKGILLYYVDILSDPKLLNTMLVTLISAGNYLNTSECGSNISTPPPSPSTVPFQEFQEPTSCPEESNLPLFGQGSETPCGAEETLMEVVASKGSIGNFLGVEPGKRKEKSSQSFSMTGIETALSGLLSATALPLLPDGVSYSLSEVCPDPVKDTKIKSKQGKASPSSPSVAQRHKSWEETGTEGKQKAITPQSGSTGSKSLDESLDNPFLSRQTDFDFGAQTPTYTEPEDFAATIAKLRSLLEQREESRTNLMEKEENVNVEGDLDARGSPPHQGSLKTQKMKLNMDSQSNASSLGSDTSCGSTFSQGNLDVERKLKTIEDDEDEADPGISRFFLDVCIPKAESCGGDSSDQFTLYCIQYSGVYIEDAPREEGMPKLILRTTTVKRTLKEFLLLHSQLEESPLLKIHLRGIKSPKTWVTLPFSSNSNSAHRRLLLQRYVQQVSSHPVLGFCTELRHFMAYGDDGFKMFAPFANTHHTPRFDRLTKTFTGVLNLLKDALPSFESEIQQQESTAEPKARKLLPSFLQFGDKNSEEELKVKGKDTEGLDKIGGASDDEGSGDESSSDSEKRKSCDSESVDELEHNFFTCMKNVDLSPRPETSFDSMYPLATAVTRFLCDVLWLPHQRPRNASVSAVMSVSGKSLEKYLTESLELLLSEEAFLGYIEWLTASVREWATTVQQQTEIDKEPSPVYTVEDLKLCLKQRLPIWVRWMWGRSRLELTIERLAEFFQIPLLNHDFFLSVTELIFSKLMTACPERLP